MLYHLNIIQKVAYLLMFKLFNQCKSGLQKLGNISICHLKVNHNLSRIRRALFTLWILFSSLVTLFLASLVWVVITLFLISVSLLLNLFLFSPFFTLFMISIRRACLTLLASSHPPRACPRSPEKHLELHLFSRLCTVAFIVYKQFIHAFS